MDIYRLLSTLGIDKQRRMRIVYWLNQRGVISQSVNGTTADFNDGTFREYRRIQTLMYETDVLERVLSAISPDDIFYDIGANIGIYTCFVGQHADRVIAFEPHAETAARLRENAALNDVEATVYEYALADKAGTAPLTLPSRTPHKLGTGEFSLRSGPDSGATWEVDVVPGDQIVHRHSLPRPTVAKIDVEGAEVQTLIGLRDSLSACKMLYVEVHRDHVAVDDVVSELTAQGFESTVLRERGNTTFLEATRD